MEGVIECEYTSMSLDNANCTKSHVANTMLQPYSLGYQLLGHCSYSYGENNLYCDHFISDGITHHPSPLPYSVGEDKS